MEANTGGIAKAYAAAETLFAQLQVWQLLLQPPCTVLASPPDCTACDAELVLLPDGHLHLSLYKQHSSLESDEMVWRELSRLHCASAKQSWSPLAGREPIMKASVFGIQQH